MRFKRHMKLEYGLKQIDTAPLVNVVFLLFIFFVLSSIFLVEPGIRIDLPRAITGEALNYENIEVSISSENTAYAFGRPLTVQELKNLLKAAAKRNQSLLIKADRRASLGRVVEIWDMARDSGIAQLNIATNQE
ncbi:MAG: biopolymer transporter ExbD [Candidatus Omnitrophica bacterium]|nr:biopolymer transporter ExbD [Candidatus Omnitrophota bacterium]